MECQIKYVTPVRYSANGGEFRNAAVYVFHYMAQSVVHHHGGSHGLHHESEMERNCKQQSGHPVKMEALRGEE